jgi:two-component system, cell cycle sensor histidine kinase and response regulator CckA
VPDFGQDRLAWVGEVPAKALIILAGLGAVLVLAGLSGLAGFKAALSLAGLSVVLLAAALAALRHGMTGHHEAEAIRTFQLIADDPAPCLATDASGRVILRNSAAEERFGAETTSLQGALALVVASPEALVLRLQRLAEDGGAARQDVPVPGGALRITAHRSGPDRLFWRLDEIWTDPAGEGAAAPLAAPVPAAADSELDQLPVAMMSFGPDGLLRRANQAARDLVMLGDARPMMFHEMFEGLGRPVSDWLSDVVSGRLPSGTEVLRARKDGEDLFLQVTLHRFPDMGRPSVMAVLNDATRLKTLEAQFAQSQKMQAIGQLAGGIAHDFNNLLTAISGHCDLLLLRHGREDPDFADLEQIRQNANRAASLVGQLLAFSRKQTLKPERLDLTDVLSDLLHLLNRLVVERVGLSLVHLGDQSGHPLGPVRADRRQLEQVIINLVINARDAMPDGGAITIETEPVTLTEALERDRARVPAGDYSVIRVRDNGHGIAPENLKKIFEPFFTTKRVGEGTGLGLSMAYGIVKQSGGFIFVDSEPGEGTMFSLYFPVTDVQDPVEPAPPEPKRPAPRQGEGVVLLVEDEAPVRAFAGRALRLRGYTVLEAASAEEALKTLEDPSIKVDVFVTDVVMPGMDGPSWVRLALRDRPQVKVIFMSGYAEDALSEDQSRVPNSVFLPKPFSLNDLTSTVQAQLQ